MRSKVATLWLGLALCWAGYWAPWIAHRAAALNFNGYELAEWTTRLPGVRDGSLRLGRLDFMLPLACLSLATALAAGVTPMRGWLRWAARLLALLGGFLILPEYPFILTAHIDPELRPTLVLGVVILGGVVIGSWVIRRLEIRDWLVGVTISLLALAALGFTIRSLVVMLPVLGELFNAPARLNWGPWALGVGAALVAVGVGRDVARNVST